MGINSQIENPNLQILNQPDIQIMELCLMIFDPRVDQAIE